MTAAREAPVGYEDVLPEEVGPWRARTARIVDVREPWASEAGHLAGGTVGRAGRELPLERGR